MGGSEAGGFGTAKKIEEDTAHRGPNFREQCTDSIYALAQARAAAIRRLGMLSP